LEVAVNHVISPGQLAYFAVALSNDIQSDLLNPHFLKNFTVYRRALCKADSFQLTIPRRANKEEVITLSQDLQVQFGDLKGWKAVNWMILAYLLVFTSQIERMKVRSEQEGKRYIHVEVHCRAFRFAHENSGTNDVVTMSFLNAEEASSLTSAFRAASEGISFSEVVSSERLAPHGIRETLRCLLEIQERNLGIPVPDDKEINQNCSLHATRWDQKEDPEASRIRVRGLVHEELLREKLRLELMFEKVLPVEETAPLRSAIHVKAKKRKSLEISSKQFVFGFILTFSLTFLLGFFTIPRDYFFAGVAWWYFLIGGFTAGSATFVSLLSRGSIEEPPLLDLPKIIGYGGITILLLCLIKPHTYHFGIAWWHAILGAGLIGEGLQIFIPVMRRLLTREEITYRFT
jgi:hypothetical protein